jgi:hypothetical protein
MQRRWEEEVAAHGERRVAELQAKGAIAAECATVTADFIGSSTAAAGAGSLPPDVVVYMRRLEHDAGR